MAKKKKVEEVGYPKGIEIEFRNTEERMGEGLMVLAHWMEVFWHDTLCNSFIDVVTGYDEEGDNIYERVERVSDGKSPDCFKFRGLVYDFMSLRSVHKKGAR